MSDYTPTNAPAQVTELMLAGMTGKSKLPVVKMFLLGILAGAFIAFGAEASSLAAHNVTQVGIQRLIMGCVFPVGLIMVVLLGTELFTGNCMMIAAVADKRVKFAMLLRNWVVVYLGNLVGAALIVLLVSATGQLGYSSNGLAVLTIKIAAAKTGLSFGAALAGGILCNVLVCVAVLLAMASKSIIGKIAGIWFPIMAFVLSGFEHSVANMYYIPAGIFASMNPAYAAAAQEAGVNMANLNALGFLGNIVPVTLGNIVGGAAIALVMWFCFRRNKEQA
ncbi:MAG: formate/nitrite transporter family protein [Coriobacteriales bacterium]|nr:formate/nitrite transporter family protein [Coriobacteriaceae bacterium]MDY2723839.1 formate/nitrite transporter family protein [Coriobacteriales bacterium]